MSEAATTFSSRPLVAIAAIMVRRLPVCLRFQSEFFPVKDAYLLLVGIPCANFLHLSLQQFSILPLSNSLLFLI